MNASILKSQLSWLSKISGEEVKTWKRVSQGDIICFILNRMKPGVVQLLDITDGVDRFARVTNWRICNKTMRKLGMGWNFDEVKLVNGDVMELFHVVKAIKRWECRCMDELLEPISPDDCDDDDLPAWFTQHAAKKLEEKKLATGETSTKKMKKTVAKVNLREKFRAERVSIAEQMNMLPKSKHSQKNTQADSPNKK